MSVLQGARAAAMSHYGVEHLLKNMASDICKLHNLLRATYHELTWQDNIGISRIWTCGHDCDLRRFGGDNFRLACHCGRCESDLCQGMLSIDIASEPLELTPLHTTSALVRNKAISNRAIRCLGIRKDSAIV